MRIGLDIDDCLADFKGAYHKRFGTPKRDQDITKNTQRKLKEDKHFWLNLDPIVKLDFEPELYCTKRVSSKIYTKRWLQNNNFPNKPIYQVYYQRGNKARYIKGKVDVFIDDSYSNFKQMNESGVNCILYDPTNIHNETKSIRSITYNNIKTIYDKFSET